VPPAFEMPFGKYQGKPLHEIPDSYVDWLLSLDDLREPLLSELNLEATRRWDPKASKQGRRIVCPSLEAAADIVKAGKRSLSQKHHPDRGGDPVTMTLINATADWLLGRLNGGEL
jgi:hypothetical protein